MLILFALSIYMLFDQNNQYFHDDIYNIYIYIFVERDNITNILLP